MEYRSLFDQLSAEGIMPSKKPLLQNQWRSTYYRVNNNPQSFAQSERKYPMKVYDAHKGYGDQFGQLVKRYFINSAFKNWKMTSRIFVNKQLDDSYTHQEYLSEKALIWDQSE